MYPNSYPQLFLLGQAEVSLTAAQRTLPEKGRTPPWFTPQLYAYARASRSLPEEDVEEDRKHPEISGVAIEEAAKAREH